jgi:single-stranded-DNA-specific exonuclease
MEYVLDVADSLSNKKWVQRTEKVPNSERLIQTVIQKYGLPEIIARAVIGRNISLEQIELYLYPKLKQLLPDPLILKDMQKGISQVANVIMSGGKIGLFADYDVDGATSAALFINFLKKINIETTLYIPDRITEGYGPNIVGIKQLANDGADLIITLDCGIAAFEVLNEAANAGLSIIVIDHHMAEVELPKAKAVINPNRIDDTSGLSFLAAVGVSFLFIVALNRQLRKEGWYEDKEEPVLIQLLDLVALGTVCDVVPLTQLNRAFVSQGLKVIASRGNVGLRVLSDLAKIEQKTDSYQLGFVLGPRINAGGRVGMSDIGAKLLSTNDLSLASTLAKTLDANNTVRKEIEASVLKEAIEQAEVRAQDDDVILVYGEKWHPGVIGIIAARLKEKFNKPACVVSFDGMTGKGSGRSIPKWDLGASIIAGVQSNILTVGGGHGMAAGFTIQRERIEEFRTFICSRFNLSSLKETISVELKLDGVLSVGGVDRNIIKVLSLLEPYGSGNPEPIFAIPSVEVTYSAIVGENHVRCNFRSPEGSTIKGIAFRSSDNAIGRTLMNHKGRRFNLAGKVKEDNWQGREGVQVIIEDVALSN